VDNRSSGEASLLPQRVEQLAWLGIPLQTVAVLEPYVTILPTRTPVNLNTASAEVIYAAVEGISMADAQRMVSERQRSHFRTNGDAAKLVNTGPGAEAFTDNRVSVASRFFEVRGRLRLDKMVIEERSVVQRDGLEVRVLQRERGVVDPTALSRAAAATAAQR
jgi:general secretion pathway protein K